MTALLFTSTIRRIEADGLARTAAGELMSRAAAAVADATEGMLRAGPAGRPILAFCGPGNNGGDALLAALLLHERGFDARAFELSGCAAGATPPEDTARVRVRAASLGLSPTRIESADALHALFAATDPVPLVIDGLFGIGLARPLDGLAAELCRLLAELGAPVVAIDVPSGVDADTGALVGSVAMPATRTVTMIDDKPGLHTGRALDHVGRVSVAPLGLEAAGQADGMLFGRREAARRLPRRPRDSSKGTFGSVLIVGGASGMSGAALLAARAAQHGGAGKVWIASPQGPVFDPGQPQLMTRDADADFDDVDVIVAGCGLGTDACARGLLLRVLGSPAAAVLDADALNVLAADPSVAMRPPTA
ncbi:MAG TPA: NAD(P)H-hydrate epimerase, partial [Burkholderiaceae bacterium]|nr:NAD(P)H-hydrate epimerase [Burkholderiaceae bacterium]